MSSQLGLLVGLGVAPSQGRGVPSPISLTPLDFVTTTLSGASRRCGRPRRCALRHGRRHLAHQPGGPASRQRTFAQHDVERLPGGPLADDVGQLAVVDGVEHLEDAGVGDTGGALGRGEQVGGVGRGARQDLRGRPSARACLSRARQDSECPSWASRSSTTYRSASTAPAQPSVLPRSSRLLVPAVACDRLSVDFPGLIVGVNCRPTVRCHPCVGGHHAWSYADSPDPQGQAALAPWPRA